MKSWLAKIVAAWDRFLFESCDPRIVPVLRIGFALLIVINASVLFVDAERWFCDSGVLRSDSARQTLGPNAWSVFYYLPSNVYVVRFGLIALLMHAFLMMLGIFSKVQSAAIFVWLVSFQNRNPLLNDGEDTLFRLFAFFMIWLPLDAYWSVWPGRSKAALREPDYSSAWGLRLIQFEMVALYASTAISKAFGNTWQNGTAMWYVSRMNDNFGRLIPSTWFDNLTVSAIATWSAILIEAGLPLVLMIRPTRKFAIIAGLMLHQGIEASMNLFLFEWIMMLGLVSFVVPSEWTWRSTSRASQ